MNIKQPKNSDRYYWTQHVYEKMKQYQISEQLVKRVVRHPERVEEGIAENTIAVMQTRGTKKKHEVWIMYQVAKSNVKASADAKVLADTKMSKVCVITAWRYPGTSPKRLAIPIPQDIIDELGIKVG